MKKVLLTTALLMLSVLVMLSCAVGVQDMQIGKAELSEEETKILNLAGFDTAQGQIYDYDVNGDIKSVEITESVLSPQGVWEQKAYMQAPIDDKGSISFAISDKELNFTLSTKEGTSSYVCKYENVSSSKTATAWEMESKIKTITPNVPIPLLLQYKTVGDAISTYSTDTYFSPSKLKGVEEVRAITVTFIMETTSK